MSTIGLLIIGDEILSGKRADAHLPRLLALLGERGMALGWAQYVGDEPVRLHAAIAAALAEPDAVILSFGGIGSTPDDHTRGCVARALGVPLVPHAEAIARIDRRMVDVAIEREEPPFDPDNRADARHAAHCQRRLMGHLPQDCDLIPNPYNGIAGFSCTQPATRARIYCMPGFPVMAHPMSAWVLDHCCAHLQRRGHYQERSLIVRGAIESELTALMQKIETDYPAVKIFSLPSVDHPEYGVHIELGIKGETALLDAPWDDLKRSLSQWPIQIGPELQRTI